LASEGLTVSDIYTKFADWKRKRLPTYRRLVEKVSDAADLLYLLKEHQARMNKVFERKKAEHALANVTSQFIAS